MKNPDIKKIIREEIKKLREQDSNTSEYDPVFSNFQELDGKINYNQLQSGIDNNDPEAIEVIRNIQSSPEHSKNITKTRMGKPIDFSKEDNLEEKKGLFCCWRKGGCCFNEYSPGEKGYPDSGGIMWHSCCSGDLGPKKCCGGVYDIY
tara:strand:+ start:1292 stop:1735 length:444 start_codon:yes stop_codon:yes gene_type:complete